MRKEVVNVISAVLCAAMVVSPIAGPLTAFATENSGASETVMEPADEREPAGGLRFVNSLTGEEISPYAVTLYNDYSISGGYFVFPGLYPGDTISYSIEEDGYEPVSGEYTLTEYSYDLPVSMEPILQEETEDAEETDPEETEEAEIVVNYMEGRIRLDGKLPEGYENATYEVESGGDVVDVSQNGTVLLKKAGEAVIIARAENRTLYITLTVEKAYIGTVLPDAISWENLTKQEDGERSLYINGTISEDSGLREGDVIYVTALASAASAFPGVHSSTLSEISFEGDENYDIQINEAGPEITIEESSAEQESYDVEPEKSTEGEAVSVTASFESGEPINGKFFASDRTMEVKFHAEDYDESLTLFEISVNGEYKSCSIDDIRSGGADGVELVSEYLTGDNGAVYKILFGDQGKAAEISYEIGVFYGDTEASYSGACPTGFVVDEIAPVLDVVYKNGDNTSVAPGTSADSPYYETVKMNVTLNVSDSFFDSHGTDVRVSSYDADGSDTGAYSAAFTDAAREGTWEEGEGGYAFTLEPFTEESNYTVSVSCTDLAGNTASAPDGYFTIDRTAPEGSVAVKKRDGETVPYEKVLEEKTSGSGVVSRLLSRFSGSRYVTLEDNYSDNMSGISSAQYALAENTETADYTTAEWQDWDGDVQVDTSRVAVVLEKVTDNAGHTAFFSSNRAPAVEAKESAAPVITIGDAESTSAGGSKIIVAVKEPDNGGDSMSSGIGEVSWAVTNPDGTTVAEGSRTAQEQEKDLEEEIILSSDDISSDVVTVNVTAQDKAGNTARASKTLSLTAGAVNITSSIDMTGVCNERYFNTKRTVKAVFGGKEFDPEKAQMIVTVGGHTEAYTMAQLEAGSGAEFMIRLNTHTDSQKSAETYTEARTNTYEIFFGDGENADIDYEGLRFSVTAEDGEVLTHDAALSVFTVDTVKPAAVVSFTENGTDITEKITENVENTYCGRLPVIMSATVTERSFDPSATVLTVAAKDSEGKTVSDAYPKEKTDAAKEEWTITGTSAAKQFEPFEKGAVYTVNLQVSDLAGNKSVAVPDKVFSIDTDAPEGTLIVTAAGKDTEYTDSREDISFALASKNGFEINCRPKDLISGVSRAEYLIDTLDDAYSGDFKSRTQEELEKLEWTEWENNKEGSPKTLQINPDAQAVLYARLTDKAGNIFYLHTDGLIADATAPKAEIRLDKPEGISRPEEDIYSTPFTIEATGTDPLSGGTYSGIKNVRVRVTADGENVQEKTFAGAELKNRSQGVVGQLKIDTEKINTNNAVITVTTTDNAGNTGRASAYFMADTVLPAIGTQMDTSDAKNERYFNSTKTIKVSFIERNYDPSRAYLHFMNGNTKLTFSMVQLLNGAAQDYGVSVTRSSDSQAGKSVKDLTDDREITYDIAFGYREGEDTLYRGISFEATDTAGNHASHTPEMDTFIIDKIKPIVKTVYNAAGTDITERITTDSSVPFCTRKAVSVTVAVTERNFYEDGMNADVTSRNHDGKDTGAYTGAASIKNGWKQDRDTYTKTLPAFTADSNYGLMIECEDLAGNKSESHPFHYFTVDTTPPTGEIVVYDDDGSEKYADFTNYAIFRHVSRNPITVARQTRDATSGIASVRYFRYTPPVNASGQFAAMSLDALRSADWQEWGSDYTVEPDSQAVMYARIADRAGNILYISTEGAMIADSTDPSYPEITITIDEPSEGIYSGNVPVSVYAQDPVSGGTYSGLRNMTVQVLNGSTVTQEASYTPGQKADRVRTYNASITVDAERNNSNYIRVRVTAEDWAGNSSSAEKELSIDITAPRIEVSYDRNDPANERYYNTARTATVTVYERNFNPSRVNLSIGGGTARVSGWSIGGAAGSSDDNPNTCTIVYEADADYTFTMDMTDMAGNHASYGQTDSFTVDTTAPVISVSYDNNNGRGRYYNAPRTAMITVEDENFDPGLFTAQIQAMLEDRGITAPQVSGWNSSGNRHTATISFNADGDYSFTLSCQDLAENPAQDYRSDSFTIDLTAPEVAISGIKDRSANRGEAAAVIQFSDINFDPAGVVIRLSGLKHEEKNVEGTFEQTAKGGTITLADFEHVITEDDVYTLTAIITDRAGNVTEKSITFSVNRFGSNFYCDDPTDKHLDRYYEKEPFDLVIYETNVNAIVDRDIIVYRNGETIKLGEKDFTAEDVSQKDDWKKYRYTVDKSVFNEEGVYEVLVSSVDEAGNRQDNKTKDTPVTFIIDKTAPSAVITGAEDGGIYNSTQRTVMVEVTDNYAVGSAEILVDGEVYGRYDAKSIGELDGKISVDIKESESWQTITASVIDAAGNENKADDMVILVTTDPITRLVNGTMFRTFVLGLMLMALVLMILFLIWKNRKKEENNTAAG